MSANIKIVPTDDLNAIIAVVNNYVEGLRVGSVEKVASAFYGDAVMYGFGEGQLMAGSIQNLYDFMDKNGNAPDINTRVDILAFTPSTAVVRVDMEKDAINADYTDFHTLIKIDGKWSIIAKVFHMYQS